MNLHEYQPVTLLDFPGKVATILFISGCPLRCPYCHNPELVLMDKDKDENKLTEFLQYIKKRKNLLDGVIVSGGEPLMNIEIIDLLHQIKSFDLKIKIDTSGINSSMLASILDNRLVDYVALDFKNVFDMLDVTCGIKNSDFLAHFVDQWKKSLSILRNASIDYEIRTTVVKNFHSTTTLLKMANILVDNEIWYIQPFKKSSQIIADFTNNSLNRSDLLQYSEQEFTQILNKIRSIHEQTYIR